MAEPDGHGDVSAALVFIFTGCAPCIVITRVIGDECERIGICGVETIITSAHVGSGVAIGESAATSTADASSSVGLALGGMQSVHTGTCGAATITTIISMDGTAGLGAVIDASEFTSTGCEPCTATTKAIGDEFALTGIFGAETITIDGLAGSGDGGDAWDAICTAFAS